MQIVSSRIWTRVIDSIPYDDSSFTERTSLYVFIYDGS